MFLWNITVVTRMDNMDLFSDFYILFTPSCHCPSTIVLDHNLGHRFRSKYHPDEASRLKAEAQSSLHSRLNVFMFLMENGWLDNASLDIEQTLAIIKVLDAGEALILFM